MVDAKISGESLAEVGRFVVVGLSNFVVSLISYMLLLNLTKTLILSGTLSQTGSYLSGIVWSYCWNRGWTFKSQSSVTDESLRFVALQLALMLLSIVAVGGAVDYMHWPETISWFVVMSVITVLNFLGMKLWVFTP